MLRRSRGRKQQKIPTKYNYLFNNFSMSDEESLSGSEFYYPKEEEQVKIEQNNMSKVTTHGDENFGNSECFLLYSFKNSAKKAI